MGDLILRPLHVGTIQRDKSIFSYIKNMGTEIEAPVLAWYIEGNGSRILVDTGGHDPVNGQLHPPYTRESGQDPVTRLAALGVRPEDIDILILTHLHWDHAANIHLFPKAKVFVQREELRYAAAPLAPHRWAYEAYPPLVLASERYEVIDGDADIAEGVTVHLTPGHTPGLQGVTVHTYGAVYFIASDNVPLTEMWNAQEKYGAPHWPCAIHVDLEAYFRSLRRMEDLGDVVLPNHDWKTLEQSEYR
ncbi:MAG: N-acyl homoserine lactonase family protein [Thermodesulfobacteriota bacterium]|jgi:glyoxylase-like metal-dependent hydrolase (beta-lactamase superfamily II)